MNIGALETKLSAIHALGSFIIAAIVYVDFRFNWDMPDTDTLISANLPPGNWAPDGIHRLIALVIAVCVYFYLRYRYTRLPLIENSV